MKNEKDLQRHYKMLKRIETAHRIALPITVILPFFFLGLGAIVFWGVIVFVICSWISYAIGFNLSKKVGMQSVKDGIKSMLKAWFLIAMVVGFLYIACFFDK